MIYKNEKCFSCQKVFDDSDDVVVCPDCGTPYHRECYTANGKCINTQLHENGKSWTSENTASASKNSVNNSDEDIDDPALKVQCLHCGTINYVNDKSGNTCKNCGEKLDVIRGGIFSYERDFEDEDALDDELDEISEAFGQTTFESNVTVKEVSMFVGTNQLYYMPLFLRMKRTGSKISFNLASLFFPYFYFANRKMWIPTVITIVLSALFSIPELLLIINAQSESLPFMEAAANYISNHEIFIKSLADVCDFGNWIMKIVCCLFANRIYYKHAVRKISKEKSTHFGSIPDFAYSIIGGVKPVNILLSALLLFGVSLIVELVVMIVLI